MITTVLASLLGVLLYRVAIRRHVLRYLAKREVRSW